jgi:hypothetical protein
MAVRHCLARSQHAHVRFTVLRIRYAIAIAWLATCTLLKVTRTTTNGDFDHGYMGCSGRGEVELTSATHAV